MQAEGKAYPSYFYFKETKKFRSIGILERCLVNKVTSHVSGSFHLEIITTASDLRFLQRNTLKITWMDRITRTLNHSMQIKSLHNMQAMYSKY